MLKTKTFILFLFEEKKMKKKSTKYCPVIINTTEKGDCLFVWELNCMHAVAKKKDTFI
jgi:hypothetical protein